MKGIITNGKTILKRKPINEEDAMLYNGTHPQFLLELKKIEEQYKEELELYKIWKKYKLETIEVAHQIDSVVLEKDYENRLNELIETLHNEAEEKKRVVENEINSMDVGSTNANNSSYFYGYANKKTLRRRVNDQTETADKKTRKHSPLTIVTLLPEAIIAEDMKFFASNCSKNNSNGNGFEHEGPQHKVSIDNIRLLYDGKSFHRGQNVSVETPNYGKFPGIIQSVCDKFVHFRSSMAGDTRQVIATKDDLEYGRVVVRKRY